MMVISDPLNVTVFLCTSWSKWCTWPLTSFALLTMLTKYMCISLLKQHGICYIANIAVYISCNLKILPYILSCKKLFSGQDLGKLYFGMFKSPQVWCPFLWCTWWSCC